MYAGVLDVRYSTFALLSASSWLRVLPPPATYVAPSWRVAPRRVVSPRGFVGVHQWWVQVVVVRNAEYSRVGSGLTYEKAPAAQRSCCAAGVVCEVVGSAVTYSPTPSRGQYHRRGRA